MNAISPELDLDAEWRRAQDGVQFHHFKSLMAAGCPPGAIASVDSWPFGVCDIGHTGDLWAPRFHGQEAIILPIHSPETGDLIDLLAFRIETPRSFWLRTGAAIMLGYENLCRTEYNNEPLHVLETPLQWMVYGDGIVILDWRHYWPVYLGNITHLVSHYEGFARRLKSFLERPLPTPEIMVRR